MEYDYPLETKPNIATYDAEGNLISGVLYDIWYDGMEDKDVHCIKWYSDELILRIWFMEAITLGDKLLLDGIVDRNK